MIKRFQPLSQFLVVLVASGWMQQAVAQIVNEQAVYQESAIYTPPPPTDISYKFVLNPGVHKNRWSRHQVAVTLFGTKGQFRKHLTKDSIVPYYWNYYDSGNLFDFSKDRSINHEKCTSAMQRAPTEDQPGCRLEWVFVATDQDVKDIGPVAAVTLDCWGCGHDDDFQYGFMYAEYRRKGEDPILSRFSKTGWLKDWGGVVRSQMVVEDGIDQNAPWRPVDCGSGLGCQVGEYFKIIDLRSSKEPYTTRINTRHEVTTDQYSRYITESRSSWEIEASVKGSFIEAKGSQRQDNETTDETGASREERRSTETDRTETVPPGYLVVYHEVIMARGEYQPSGMFNLGTRLSDVQTANTRLLFFANDKFGTPRRYEWRGSSDGKSVFEMLDERIDSKYEDLLRAAGFL